VVIGVGFESVGVDRDEPVGACVDHAGGIAFGDGDGAGAKVAVDRIRAPTPDELDDIFGDASTEEGRGATGTQGASGDVVRVDACTGVAFARGEFEGSRDRGGVERTEPAKGRFVVVVEGSGVAAMVLEDVTADALEGVDRTESGVGAGVCGLVRAEA